MKPENAAEQPTGTQPERSRTDSTTLETFGLFSYHTFKPGETLQVENLFSRPDLPCAAVSDDVPLIRGP
jgi:hypothetical protein